MLLVHENREQPSHGEMITLTDEAPLNVVTSGKMEGSGISEVKVH